MSMVANAHIDVSRVRRTTAMALIAFTSLAALPPLIRVSLAPVRDTLVPAVADMASKPPIDIRADRLETSKAENRAVYSGNVEAIQGRQRLRTPQLTIYTAEKEPAADKRGLASAGGDVGKIKRMEAEGPAFFNDDTQNARGDHGTYVAADDTITLTGNVVLLQGTNVTLADKVVIDQTTHHATLYSGKTMPRIRSVFREDNSSKAPPSVELPPSN